MADPPRTVLKQVAASRPRKVDKVPFVELYAGRLQGVVSSGSDEDRVYVSYFEAGSTNYYCSTNNNRPCGGLRGSPCKHLDALMGEALLQFGAGRVVAYMDLTAADPDKVKSAADLMKHVRGGANKVEAGMVFSRFVAYLAHVKLPPTTLPVPEMGWFVR